MKALVSFVAVLLLVLVAYAGASVAGLRFLFGVVIPYAVFAIFVVGMVVRILKWASSPVPFRIPTTTGQQKSLPWIKHSTIESPSNVLGVIARMALEVLVFRSLFRNLKTQVGDGKQVTYGEAKWLWAAGLAFHWSFLIILIRHMRFFIEQVPAAIQMMEGLDSFLQICRPTRRWSRNPVGCHELCMSKMCAIPLWPLIAGARRTEKCRRGNHQGEKNGTTLDLLDLVCARVLRHWSSLR